MTGRATLIQRLQELAAAGAAGAEGRAIRASSANALLVRLMREIEGTLMPRRLTFRAGGDRALAVIAANGRLLRAEVAAGDAAFEQASVALGRAFEQSDVTLAEPLKGAFLALIGESDTVLVLQQAISETLDPERAGVSVSALAETWGLKLSSDAVPDSGTLIDSFLARSLDLVSAWLLTGLEVSGSDGAGDQDRVEELAAFAEARRETGEAARQAARTRREPWSLLALHRAPQAPDATVILAVDDILLYIAIPRARLGDLLDHWRLVAET